MRKVNRQAVTHPNRLLNLTKENLAHLTDHKKISPSIYGHNDVKKSLQELYFDKCYICECDVSDGKYDVEHYKSTKFFPELGYSWENLHKVCEKCNLAKEKKEFLIKSGDSVVDVKLLDPSSTVYDINQYIKYDIDSMLMLVDTGTDPIVIEKAKQTIDYLNGKTESDYCRNLPYRRMKRVNKFLKFCMADLIPHKDRIKELKLTIDNYTSPQEPLIKDIDQFICNKLMNADAIYLSEKAKFSTCTKINLYPVLEITYDDLKNITRKMSLELGF